jgi:hypothetical protein
MTTLTVFLINVHAHDRKIESSYVYRVHAHLIFFINSNF